MRRPFFYCLTGARRLEAQREVGVRAVQVRFIVTFYNNTGAMAFKKACEERGVAGELIPIPKQLEAGCGLVWSAPLTARVALTQLLDDPSIVWCERTILELEGL